MVCVKYYHTSLQCHASKMAANRTSFRMLRRQDTTNPLTCHMTVSVKLLAPGTEISNQNLWCTITSQGNKKPLINTKKSN